MKDSNKKTMKQKLARHFLVLWEDHKKLLFVAIALLVGTIIFASWHASFVISVYGFWKFATQTQHIAFMFTLYCLGGVILCTLVLSNAVRTQIREEEKLKGLMDECADASTSDEPEETNFSYICGCCKQSLPLSEFERLSAQETIKISASHPSLVLDINGKYYSHVCHSCESKLRDIKLKVKDSRIS